MLSVVLPIATLIFVSVQRLATAFPSADNFTLEHYRTALSLNAIRSAMGNSLLLGVLTATIGVVLTGLLAWLIQRSKMPGRAVLEYIVMFPQAVPRLVFAFGMMWAWIVFPIPVYGTLWILLIAYLTVFLPLGVRTISGVLVQLDKSLEECGEVCGASWGHRLRTITMPLLRPGLLAAWLLIFIASVRELGASILLMGPNSKVLTPAIVEAFFSSLERADRGDGADPDGGGRRRHAAVSVHHPPRRAPGSIRSMAETAHIEVEDLVIRYGAVAAVGPVSFTVPAGEQLTLLGPSGCGKTTTLRAVAGLEQPDAGSDPHRRQDDVRRRRPGSTCRPSSAASRWCSSPTRSGRT